MSTVTMVEDTVEGRHGDISIRRYFGSTPTATPLIWLHGGGFTAGGLTQPESHAPAMRVAEGGRSVVTVDYSLVPGWSPFRRLKPPLDGVRYPVPLDDVIDVIDVISAESGRFILGGASAGAALSASATKRLLVEGGTPPQALLLAYGMFHSALPDLSPELRRRVSGRHGLLQFKPRIVYKVNVNYLGTPDLLPDPIAFPGGHGGLSAFPPTSMIDADRDTLRASGSAFYRELREAGVDVSYRMIENSTHGFFNKPSTSAFERGMVEMITFLDRTDLHLRNKP